ncbi:MAG TPA: glycoside hydrolase family 9 protein [Opitutaceae bacterium]|nr:glycoside hydrolase family 9 protein [Opitutaceae bacterium]
MKHPIRALFTAVVLATLAVAARAVEATWNYAVQVTASVQASPASITLSWTQDTTAIPASYTVHRKLAGASSWGPGTALPGSATTYTDATVSVGTAYEYQIVKAASGYTGYGYIQAGIAVPLVENRGKLVLVVDNTHAAALTNELTRLEQDLAGDGWTVVRRDVARTDSPAAVKNQIKAVYSADPANVKAVFLFGHVAVPYSGQFNPDGHPDHIGAWPADVYYGDMDGNWTDSTVNYTQTLNTDAADAARITNKPGDGKFDQTTMPSPVELWVGRVDLANMPGKTSWNSPATFPSETELLRQYLNKDHNFRHKKVNVQRRAIVGDYFGVRSGEAFAASGYRSAAPLVGNDKITNLNVLHNDQKGVWVPALAAGDYLFAYGCGAGAYRAIAGLGNTGNYNDANTVEMVTKDVKGVFNMLFGSWLGDWDHEDSILRSVLATKSYGLTAVWSGRPHWFMHPMGLGEPIGATAKIAQNNGGGLYKTQRNSNVGNVHVALMGDPTLRLHPVAPPASVGGTVSGASVALTWAASSDSVVGYHVYRATSAGGPFARLTSSLLTTRAFTDLSAPSGATYMVRAVKLETSPSGTYYNASQGVFWKAGGAGPVTGGDTTAPTVSVTAPATASGTSVAVSATASDNVGVAGVQFLLGGNALGAEDTAAPFSTTWNSTTATNGSHVLTAVARDAAGNRTTSAAVTVNVSNGTTTTPPPTPTPSAHWVDDALPAGTSGSASGGDSWNWVTSAPAPFAGTRAHQSATAAGLHEHAFNWASSTMAVQAGDVLYTYIYLDPANLPTEIMISWLSDNWEHRAYWGANSINYGRDGTNSRRRVGDLPAAGQWVRLEVPASQVGLEGHNVKGMSFALFGGRATWDATGRAPAAAPTTPDPGPSTGIPTATVAATDTSAVIGTTDYASFTFTRAGGSTSTALKIKFTLGGTAVKWIDYRRPEGDMPVEFTIPAGAASATMNIRALANSTNINPQTVTVTLAADATYAIGTQRTGAATITPTGTTVGGGSGSFGVPMPDFAAITIEKGLAELAAGGSTGSTGGSTGSSGSTAPSGPIGGALAVLAATSIADYAQLAIPAAGSATLHVLSPTTLELVRVNTAPTGTAVDSWNFVDGAGGFVAPATNRITVTVNGQAVAVQSVGFKRRPLYAPLVGRDLRVANSLVLQLATPVADGQTVEVKNPDAGLWPATMIFKAAALPLRYSPAVHVNQEGYVPSLPKKAQVGYYLGNLGEMNIPATTFTLVNASTGATVHTGTLRARPDSGWVYTPAPYQKVFEADFTSFAQPGEYRLVVPGLGASLPFRIDDGVAMGFARTYAQGLYHQRCGHANALPFTRHTHDACHLEAAAVPVPAANFAFTWTTVAADATKVNANNPAQTAPKLTSEATQLFPFVKTGALDVSGGHHDAGDYSKYTINSAGLVHFLMFAVDSLSGVAALDNLGLPESGDGISDLLQEAKIEADFLAKIQDTDGGFYFLVYPKDRRYESNVLPDRGDAQVVWPKNTAATAAAVAALAETASSPRFKAAYPQAAADYLAKAKLGWKFLTDAVAKHGKAGAYQKLTHYGDDFTHDDELAWAAAAMFAATGDAAIHATLKSWYDPASPSTWRWGWWHGYMSYGNAVRAYAFAVRSGRLPAASLDAGYLAKCEAEVRAAANDAVKWSGMSAYGTSFPDASKRQMSAGWYFSAGQAFDLAVGRQLEARADYLDAMLANLNYEGGSNGVNVAYVTGLGWKRQKEIVHQYAQNDDRALPPSGIPLGGLQTGPVYTATYGTDLAALTFPRDNAASGPHGFYDRWSDTFNVTTEFVHLDQARSLAASAYLATLTSAKSQAWKSTAATITGIPATPALGTPITVALSVPGMDLAGARILWEAKGQAPAWGGTYTFTPGGYGSQWVEAEAQWADGRRVVARATLFAENGLPTVSVAATDATATLGSATDTATWTFTRAGSTAEAIKVPFKFSGTAVKWNDYRRPEGDMPAEVTIPAGATTATLTIRAIANTTGANPQTAVLTLSSGSGFNVGAPYSATVTIK